MNEWLDQLFNFAVVIFTVANLAALGLEMRLVDALKILRSAHAVGLILLWGWIVGPALAVLIVSILPLAEGHAAGLLLISLAPAAPFLPLMVRRANGDMSFAAAVMLLTTIGTVMLLPLIAPMLIEGLTVDAWSLAKPLLMLVLLPMVVGTVVRFFAEPLADKLFPAVSRIGSIFLLLVLAMTLVLFGRGMLDAVGSFAPVAQILFFVVITVLAYTVGFRLKQKRRSSIALAMCTRNIAAVFTAFFGITNPPAGMFVMVVLVVPLAAIVALVAARIFAEHATDESPERNSGS